MKKTQTELKCPLPGKRSQSEKGYKLYDSKYDILQKTELWKQ